MIDKLFAFILHQDPAKNMECTQYQEVIQKQEEQLREQGALIKKFYFELMAKEIKLKQMEKAMRY